MKEKKQRDRKKYWLTVEEGSFSIIGRKQVDTDRCKILPEHPPRRR